MCDSSAGKSTFLGDQGAVKASQPCNSQNRPLPTFIAQFSERVVLEVSVGGPFVSAGLMHDPTKTGAGLNRCL